MKKNFFAKLVGVLLLAVMGLTMGSCKGCSESEEKAVVYHDYDGVVQDFTAGVSNVQALHRLAMYSLVGGEYQWRNSKVIFNDSITAENLDDLHVTDINDVFYYWNEQGPWVQMINTNVKSGTQIPWPINDVWIEDANMSEVPIKLSAEDVLARLKEWNGVLPPAKSMSLRLPVGPKDCNAQWVIGDVYNVIFIDAVTGEIADSNPAFPSK